MERRSFLKAAIAGIGAMLLPIPTSIETAIFKHDAHYEWGLIVDEICGKIRAEFNETYCISSRGGDLMADLMKKALKELGPGWPQKKAKTWDLHGSKYHTQCCDLHWWHRGAGKTWNPLTHRKSPRG